MFSKLKTLNPLSNNARKSLGRWYNATSRRKTKRYARRFITEVSKFNGVPAPRVVFRQRSSFLSRLTGGGRYAPYDPQFDSHTGGCLTYWKPGRIDERVIVHEVYHHLQTHIDNSPMDAQAEADAIAFTSLVCSRRII